MDDTASKGTARETKPRQAGHPAAPAAEPKGYRGLTLKEAAQTTPCPTVTDTEASVDLVKMRAYRLGRLRAQMHNQDIAACVLLSPYSIRYATGVRNCAIFQTHIPAGYLFVPAEGPTVYFDSPPGLFTAKDLETVDETRTDVLPLSFMFASDRLGEWSRKFAGQITDLLDAHGGGNRRLAVEWGGPRVLAAFEALGVEVLDAADVVEPARAIKSPEEVLCMNAAIAAAEDGMWRMREALEPGMSEVELWSHLWSANIEAGGDWIECRLLASGDRTNPWQQEASSRKIRPNELVCFDTDMIGPFGYCADISRAYFSGPGKPSDEQRELYSRAFEEVHSNLELMKPGAGFRELTERSFRQPERFQEQHYPVLAHGVGMSDEWPAIYYPQDEAFIYDGALAPGMTLSVESYVGEVGGREGVKLEQQILITEDGHELLVRFPFEDDLLGWAG
jgi:Xaa-Pro aminopeptidase